MSNNAAKRALRGITVGRHNWTTFAGSDDGGRRAAAIYTLIETPSSTTSIRKLGSLTSWHVYRTILPGVSTNCCPGTGSASFNCAICMATTSFTLPACINR